MLACGTSLTLIAPVALARPRLVSKYPMTIMIAWVVALVAGAGLTATGLMLMVGPALIHHVEHEAGHSVDAAITETILGWSSVGAIGILAFRVGATVGDLRAEERDSRRETLTLVESGEPVLLGSVKSIRIHSATPFIGAFPSYGRVVFSSGLENALTCDQLLSAAAHEQAHLDRHHRGLLTLARIAASSAPFIPASRHMLQAMRVATELDADDVASSQFGAVVTSSALLASYPNEIGVAERVARLNQRTM